MKRDNLEYSSQIYNSSASGVRSVGHTGTAAYVAILKPNKHTVLKAIHSADNGSGAGGPVTVAIVRRGYDPSIGASDSNDPYVIPALGEKTTNDPADFAPDVSLTANNPANTSDQTIFIQEADTVAANGFITIAGEAIGHLNPYDELWVLAGTSVDVLVTYA